MSNDPAEPRGPRRANGDQPMEWPSFFSPEMAIAWLLRTDVRRPAELRDAGAQRDFVAWWFLEGGKQYPAARTATEEQIGILYEQVAVRHRGTDLKLPRLLAYMWRTVDDARANFDIATDAGLRQFICWVLVFYLPNEQLQHLPHQPLASLVLVDDPTVSQFGDRPISVLMHYLWTIRPDARQAYDLATAEGQAGLSAWFSNFAIGEMRIGYLFEPVAMPRPVERELPVLRSDGVNLVGFARGELGIGEDLRMMVASCEAAGIPYSIYDALPGAATSLADDHLVGRFSTELPFDTTILCLTGFDTARLYIEQRELFEGRYMIGYWPWELPTWPQAWEIAFGLVDEIWSSSRFTAEAFMLRSPVPVLRMPMAVAIDRITRRSRQHFRLPPAAFLYLFVFDFNSYPKRKNPDAVVAAFKAAFPGNPSVGLVIKAMGGNDRDPAWRALVAACREDGRITLFTETLRRGDALALIDVCDCLVSLHRSEGFGRTLAEAMLLKKPVVATDFSGSCDMVSPGTGYPVQWSPVAVDPGDYPAGDHSWWAEPVIADAVAGMRKIHGSPFVRAALGAAGHALIAQAHAPMVVGVRYAARLQAIRDYRSPPHRPIEPRRQAISSTFIQKR